MKMIPGSGVISDYGNYIDNCQKKQWPYKIPVTSIDDVQLFIDIGSTKPDAIQYQLIHTCGKFLGTVEILDSMSYVIGQRSDDTWYGVFKNFSDAGEIRSYEKKCFVLAIILTFDTVDQIYFSEEYCVEDCEPLMFLKGCYGHLDTLISTDRQGVYFGFHSGSGIAIGDTSVSYQHQAYVRNGEVFLSALKKTFKQGRTRTFRVETEDVYQFNCEFLPEWYVREIGCIFDRGEVFFNNVKYLVDSVSFELIDDCNKTWKPGASLKESYYQSFSCEDDPCGQPPSPVCCDPVIFSATVIGGVCCDPAIINAVVGTNCTQYTNNTGDLVNGVSYTLCTGEVQSNVTIEAGISICVQNGTLVGGELLTNDGPC